MTTEWPKEMKKFWKLDMLVEAAAMLCEQEQLTNKAKSKITFYEEDTERRFFYIFPRKSRYSVCRRNLNGASTSTSLMIPCDFETNYSQFQWPCPSSSPSILGDYSNPQRPHFSEPSSSSSPLLLEYHPQNPNSQSSPCKSRKRPAVQQRNRTGGGLKKAKVAPSSSWTGKETPEWLVQMMRDAKLIFAKDLSLTDVNATQSRLLIPFNKLQRNDFLTPDESSYIHGQGPNNAVKKPGIEAVLVNENSEKWSVNFKIWEMKKDSGKGSLNYTLNGGWNNFVEANGLKKGHNINLWSFRCNGLLYFALVRH